MAKKKRRAVRSLGQSMDDLHIKLHDMDQKLDYLIKNLRRCNSGKDIFHSHPVDFTD